MCGTQSGTDRALRARHSSKSFSTRATGNTEADPSSKSRLPTPRSSSVFVWKTTNPHGRQGENFRNRVGAQAADMK